jgi:hypothetical protein
MPVKKIFVDCRRGGKLIASYEHGWPIAVLPVPAPDRKLLIDQAKSQLTTDRLASPPYDDITFEVRYP